MTIRPALYDAVSLRHFFGTIERLEILAARCLYLDRPHWTQAVYDEITEAAHIGQPGCRAIINAAWLAEPIEPENADLKGIYQIHVGLNECHRPPIKHIGEAEGIYFAENAPTAASSRTTTEHMTSRCTAWAKGRVFDTVDLLREAVGYGEMDDGQARNVANAIRSSGRDLRRVHPSSFGARRLRSLNLWPGFRSCVAARVYRQGPRGPGRPRRISRGCWRGLSMGCELLLSPGVCPKTVYLAQFSTAGMGVKDRCCVGCRQARRRKRHR